MKKEKTILLRLCDELGKKNVDPKKVKKLLSQTDIPPTEDPFELTNHILKRLHPYQETP